MLVLEICFTVCYYRTVRDSVSLVGALRVSPLKQPFRLGILW